MLRRNPRVHLYITPLSLINSIVPASVHWSYVCILSVYAIVLYLAHTNLNRKSWYIRATVAQVLYRKVLCSIKRDSTNYAPASVYSTISNVLQIGMCLPKEDAQ